MFLLDQHKISIYFLFLKKKKKSVKKSVELLKMCEDLVTLHVIYDVVYIMTHMILVSQQDTGANLGLNVHITSKT